LRPALLGPIQLHIRRLEQRRRAFLARRVEAGAADADRDAGRRRGTGMGDHQLGHCLAQRLRDLQRLNGIGFRHQEHQLFAAVARRQVGRAAHVGAGHARDRTQGAVAGRVAI
jgi:hypothetical protein